MLNRKLRNALSLSIPYAFLLIATVFATFPLVWLISSSLKSPGEITGDPLSFIPDDFTLVHYRTVLFDLGMLGNLQNSLVIGGSTTVVTIVVSCLAAYGIARLFPRVGERLTQILITTYMFPPILLAVPYTVILVALGLVNSYAGLVLAYLSFSIPYAIWMLTAFYRTVPIEIEEAAAVDGAGRLRIFLSVSTPIVIPGIVATAIYTFINAFNEFLFALLLINDTDKMPVAVALYSLTGAEVLDWGAMTAASTVVALPSVIFFFVIQRHIAAGLSEGSVK